MTNHDLPKTPTEIEYGSTKLGISSVPAIPESWFPEAMLWGKPYSSPAQVRKTVDPVLSSRSGEQRTGNSLVHPRLLWNPPRSYQSG